MIAYKVVGYSFDNKVPIIRPGGNVNTSSVRYRLPQTENGDAQLTHATDDPRLVGPCLFYRLNVKTTAELPGIYLYRKLSSCILIASDNVLLKVQIPVGTMVRLGKTSSGYKTINALQVVPLQHEHEHYE
jgi:hypothetical protein